MGLKSGLKKLSPGKVQVILVYSGHSSGVQISLLPFLPATELSIIEPIMSGFTSRRIISYSLWMEGRGKRERYA